MYSQAFCSLWLLSFFCFWLCLVFCFTYDSGINARWLYWILAKRKRISWKWRLYIFSTLYWFHTYITFMYSQILFAEPQWSSFLNDGAIRHCPTIGIQLMAQLVLIKDVASMPSCQGRLGPSWYQIFIATQIWAVLSVPLFLFICCIKISQIHRKYSNNYTTQHMHYQYILHSEFNKINLQL